MIDRCCQRCGTWFTPVAESPYPDQQRRNCDACRRERRTQWRYFRDCALGVVDADVETGIRLTTGRLRVEARLLRVATNAQLFAGRKSTSIADREWAIRMIAALAALTQPERETEAEPCR